MTQTPATSVTPAPTPVNVYAPPIWGYLDYYPEHNLTQHADFQAGGPVALVRKYVLPALAMGYARIIVRWIPEVDWAWLDSWREAFANIAPCSRPIWYCNPTDWTLGEARRIAESGGDVILEFLGQQHPKAWMRGYLRSVEALIGVEPGIEKTDETALRHGLPMVLTDHDWTEGHRHPDGWFGWQVKPETYTGGVLRWWQGKVFADLPAWYAQQRQPWCKGVIVPCDAAVAGWTAAKIRGEA